MKRGAKKEREAVEPEKAEQTKFKHRIYYQALSLDRTQFEEFLDRLNLGREEFVKRVNEMLS